MNYEKLHNIRGLGLTGATRFVDVEMEQGVSFENYYWLEGPLPGDIGKRIVVLHSNQIPQCGHCLRRSGLGCPAMGNGKTCERSGTKRAKMNEYMEGLKMKVGYVSLKIRHFVTHLTETMIILIHYCCNLYYNLTSFQPNLISKAN